MGYALHRAGSESARAVSAPPSMVLRAAQVFCERARAKFRSRLQWSKLFGSYARADYSNESDVDVVIVIDQLTHAERRILFDLAADVFDESDVPISPLCLSVSEWDTLKAREYRIAADIEREGIVL